MSDFLASKKTRRNYPVEGLFKDGQFIRGYYQVGGTWFHSTWFYHNGKNVLSDEGWSSHDLVIENESILL